MFNINVIYIVLSLNIDNNQKYQYYILTDSDGKLPLVSIQNNDSIFAARSRCIKQHTLMELVWLDDKLLDIELVNNDLNIYYSCSLPIETKIYNGKFIPINAEYTMSPYIQKAISRA